MSVTEAKIGTLSQIEQLKAENPNLVFSSAALEYLTRFEKGETDGVTCWREETIERKRGSKIEGVGLFARNDIEPNTVIAIKPGHVVGKSTIKENTQVIKGSHQQIGLNSFLTGLTPKEVDKNLVGYNHSCDPNAKVVVIERLPIAFLVSKKPIRKGEEITADYSTSQSSNTHRIFVCRCGGKNCRQLIQPGYDWQDEQFQQEHFEDFPFFIREKIEEMKKMPDEVRKSHQRINIFFKCSDIITILSNKDNKNIPKPVSDEEESIRTGLLLAYAGAFAKLCPFDGNIAEMRVDADSRESVQEHLQELIALAGKIDQIFN